MAEPFGRVDKWLWHARVTKTRTLAQRLVTAGKLRINRVKTDDPAHKLKVGDVLTITLERRILIYEVVDFAERRGPYEQARLLFRDLSAPATDTTESRQEPAPDPRGPVWEEIRRGHGAGNRKSFRAGGKARHKHS